MRIVIDCNVIISAGLSDSVSRIAVLVALHDHQVLVSPEIVIEYRNVARRPKFPVPVRAFLSDLVDGIADLVGPTRMRDPKDVIYVLTAVAGHADAILTGNFRDFTETHYGGARVISVREFLALYG